MRLDTPSSNGVEELGWLTRLTHVNCW